MKICSYLLLPNCFKPRWHKRGYGSNKLRREPLAVPNPKTKGGNLARDEAADPGADPPVHFAFGKNWTNFLSGYPFEVAAPEELISIFVRRGFTLKHSEIRGGNCNDFVFSRDEPHTP